MNDSSPNTATGDELPLVPVRADATRNRRALLDATRDLLTQRGGDLCALEIARRAGVGVGTLYRRFGTKEALIDEAVLQIMQCLVVQADRALEQSDPWQGLTEYLTALTCTLAEYTALLDLAGENSRPTIRRATECLRAALQSLADRAHAVGVLRKDITWEDLACIPQAAITCRCALGLIHADEQWRRILAIMLSGIHVDGASALLGSS